MHRLFSSLLRFMRTCAAVLTCLCSCIVVLCVVATVLMGANFAGSTNQAQISNADIMNRYDMAITNRVSSSLEGILSIKKVFWLRDEDVIAPKPDPAAFGEADSPAELGWLLEAAAPLLDGQSTLFSETTQIRKGTKVRYYLDETILAIVWQEQQGEVIYTLAEVKVAHASQFRRFFAGNTYGYDKQYQTTKMSADVNAVMAASADFYMFRQEGAVVYNGIVERADTKGTIDSCFIDNNGDMILSHHGELTEMLETQRFVDDHNIRFSISFGPIMIKDGVNVAPKRYALGDIQFRYPRAALCQADTLHYYVITANCRSNDGRFPTIQEFSEYAAATGCRHAYTLDGGQTATISINHQLINPVQYGSQRKISDILYFATAIPDGG